MAQKLKHKEVSSEEYLNTWLSRKNRHGSRSCVEVVSVETKKDGKLKVWYKETDVIYMDDYWHH